MKESQVVIFEKELADRASMMGWNKSTQNILKFTNKEGKTISLTAKYDQIDAGTLCTACEHFIQANDINSNK